MNKIKLFFKNTKLDGYFVGDLMFVLVFALYGLHFLPSLKKYTTAPIFVFFIVACGLCYLITMFTGKTLVSNKYGKTIYAKCENDGTVIAVESGSSQPYVDAINVDGVVYKVSDGVKVVVDESGKVFSRSFIIGSFNNFGFKRLLSSPGNDWDELFSK